MPIPILLQTDTQEVVLAAIPFEHPLNHPDVIWVNMPGEILTIDRVRVLEKDVLTKPYSQEVRVFVLQNLELATIEAQQALLKLFEEPPQHIRFILTSLYPTMILSTILSRIEIQPATAQTPFPNELSMPEFPNLSARLQWAANPAVLDQPHSVILALLSQQIALFEQNPTIQYIQKLKILKQTLTFLQAKTNPKLALEWFALRF